MTHEGSLLFILITDAWMCNQHFTVWVGQDEVDLIYCIDWGSFIEFMLKNMINL